MKKLKTILGSVILFIIITLTVHAVILPIETYRPYIHSAFVPEHPRLMTSGISQVILFTGAEQYKYPIEVPAGTNELQPTFEIVYDSTKITNKPTLVGTGWEITNNYIQTNINYTLNNASDDIYELVLNGLKYPLVYIASENRFHTQDETFMYIENKTGASNGDTTGRYWILQTKDGTSYRFGFNTDSTMLNNKNTNIVWRWSLDLINDTHNNTIYYTYSENPFSTDSSAVYLNKIEYNSDRKRVVNFVYETSTRPDLWMTFENGARVNESRRLKEIFTIANSQLVKRYVFEYTSLGSTMRTAIANITVYGNDNSTTLPPVKFVYNTFSEGWASDTTWDIPSTMNFVAPDNNDTGVRFINFNGDSLMDIIKINAFEKERQLNNGSGWQNTTMWNNTNNAFVMSTGEDEGMRVEDLDHDGYDDLIRAVGTSARTNYINNGSDWFINSTWNLPYKMGFADSASGYDLGVRLIDVNGDGWSDVVKSTTSQQDVFLNNATKTPNNIWWNVSSIWALPTEAAFVTSTLGKDLGVRMVDVNRDGLPDILKGEGTTIKTWLNSGNGTWLRDSKWDIPSDATFVNSTYDDQGVRIADVNGDGLPDLMKGYGTTLRTWLNNGNGWTETASWALPTSALAFVDTNFKNTGARIADVNGDELPDIVKQNYTDTLTYLDNATRGYLLKNITFDYGGAEGFTYASTSLFNDTGNYSRAYLPFNMWVVSNVSRNNNMTGASVQQYSRQYTYHYGIYDSRTGEFRGFGYVQELIDNILTRHYFYQDDAKTGQEYITSIHSANGVTYQNTTRNWAVTNQNGINITQLSFESTETFDQSATGQRTIIVNYSYDAFGNILEINNSGDYDITGDETYQKFEYANNSARWIVDKVINETLYGFSATNKVRQTFYQYDNQSYGVAPTKGDITLKEDWLNGGTNPTTRYDYDSYGNVVLENDTNSHETLYIFGLNDTTYTFANKVKNPINHTEEFIYDLGTGNLLQRNDSNSITTNYTYDALGRSQKEIMPLDDSTNPTSQYEYSIDGTAPETVKVTKREVSGTSNTHDIYYFYDGYGNLIQIKEDSENNQQIVMDIFYDSYDRVKAISNQYYATFSTAYSSPNLSIATINYTYDPMNRVVNVTNPDQSQIEIIFNRWNVTVYDENDNRMDYANDAYGRIITVKEYNDSVIFYTNYTYNAAGDLIQINDTYGNTFNSTYDTLGRKTQMQDPDLGTWNYTYDGVGNVLLESGPRGNKIQYIYDTADRVLRKNATDTFVNYTYDLPYNGTVAMIVLNGTVINYTYDNRLRKIADRELINGRMYVNNYSYDAANRITQQILPTGKVINYTYTEDNLLKTVSNLSTFVVNMTYNQFKLPTARKYNNTKITNITYNQTNARVTQINTTGLQELKYNYDAVGNVLKINDTPHGLVTTMQYDDLNRLTYVEQRINNSLDNFYNYTYNAIGNLLTIQELNQNMTLIYNSTPLHAPTSMNATDIINNPPTHNTPILNSTYGTNTTTENLTVYNISTFDADSDPVKNIYNWLLNNVSIATVNMPFEGGSNTTYTKDYSGFGNNGVVSNAVWNSSGGFDGKGAYEFNRANNKFIEITNVSVANFTVNFTLLMWIKPIGNSDSTTPMIIDRGGSSASGGYHIFWSNVSNTTQFQIQAFSGLRNSVPPANSVPRGAWSCLGVTYNGTTMSTYINGTLRKANSYTTYEHANVTNTVNVHFGGANYETAHFFNGTIDDVMLINKLLSQEQINAFCQQNRNTIVSQTTTAGETWNASITPNDGNADGITKYSNNLIILNASENNTIPIQETPILNSTYGTNLTTENLTVYNISTFDADSDPVKNIYNWYLNNVSITNVNMPFEGGSNSIYTKDYSGFENHGVVSNAVWNATAGFDGKGAYEFNKANNKFIEITNVSVGNFTVNFTLLVWIKPIGNTDTTTPLIIDRGGTSASGGYNIFWANVTKTTQFQLTAFSGLRSSTPPANSVPVGVWSCIGVTYNGTALSTYINGTLKRINNYSTYEHANVTNTVNVHIGGANYETAHFFNGTIDDVMLINKLLSQEQINAFCQQNRDTIVSQTTTAGETWNASITPNDGNADGITKYSNNLIIQ